MRGWTVAAACGLLAACQVGPEYARPLASTPATWDAGAGASPRWPATDWWKAFGSQQLNALIAHALGNNLDIAAAVARLDEADAQAVQAGAPLLPSLGLSSNNGALRELNPTGNERHRSFTGGVLQASYQLDFWGKNRSALQAAQATELGARYSRQVVALSTQASVATTYFGVLGLDEQVLIVQRNLARQRGVLSGLSTMARSGVIPALEVAQQQTVVETLAATLPSLVQQAEEMHTTLAILVGVLPESLHLQPERLSDLTMPPVVSGMPSELLERRPDVQLAEATLRAANANIRVAHAAFLPSLDLTANGGVASYALTHFTTSPLGIYDLTAQLTAPIFEGGLLRGQLRYAQAVYREDLASYRKATLSAFGDVENALTTIKASADAASAQDAAVRSAAQTSQMAHEAFKGGTTTVLNILTAEGTLVGAEEAHEQAQVAHAQAIVGLFDALGGGWSATSHLPEAALTRTAATP